MRKMIAFIAFTILTSTHAEFRCFGTEPFWNLTITNNTVTFYGYATPVTETIRGMFSSSEKILVRTDTKSAAITKTDQCNDGMSEAIYDFDITLTGTEYGSVVGCCFTK